MYVYCICIYIYIYNVVILRCPWASPPQPVIFLKYWPCENMVGVNMVLAEYHQTP